MYNKYNIFMFGHIYDKYNLVVFGQIYNKYKLACLDRYMIYII